jgi:hypothetical protein
MHGLYPSLLLNMPNDSDLMQFMAKRVVDLLLERELERHAVDERWAAAPTVSLTLRQDRREPLLEMFAYTRDDPPKFYKVWKWLDLDEVENGSVEQRMGYVGAHIANMLMSLDTYLDERCGCVPGEHGGPGEPCAWHSSGCGSQEKSSLTNL